MIMQPDWRVTAAYIYILHLDSASWAMRTKISMIAVNMTAYPSVRKPALEPLEPVELEFARDTRSRARFGAVMKSRGSMTFRAA
jgi:hypothetical protein